MPPRASRAPGTIDHPRCGRSRDLRVGLDLARLRAPSLLSSNPTNPPVLDGLNSDQILRGSAQARAPCRP
eukprot:238452-Pyramimonas_sp.AAC.1